MAVYLVNDKSQYKAANLENWHANAEFWLQGKMRHIRDIRSCAGSVLKELVADTSRLGTGCLIDFGCGEGWLFRLLRECGLKGQYVGLDFNEPFVEFLSKQHAEDKYASFRLYDIESDLPDDLVGTASIAVNFFNLFEIAVLDKAFANISSSLRLGGDLLIVSIDPVMQMLAVTETREQLIEVLTSYEKQPNVLGYDKDIDVGDIRSGRIYKSLFYSSATYVELGKKNGLHLFDYREVVKTANLVPQIYEFLFFRRVS